MIIRDNFVNSAYKHMLCPSSERSMKNKKKYSSITVKILKFGTPQTIAIVVLKIEKFDVTLH